MCGAPGVLDVCRVFALTFVKNNYQFFSAVTPKEVGFPKSRFYALSYFFQAFVSGLMAIIVINYFKMIDIYQYETK